MGQGSCRRYTACFKSCLERKSKWMAHDLAKSLWVAATPEIVSQRFMGWPTGPLIGEPLRKGQFHEHHRWLTRHLFVLNQTCLGLPESRHTHYICGSLGLSSHSECIKGTRPILCTLSLPFMEAFKESLHQTSSVKHEKYEGKMSTAIGKPWLSLVQSKPC